MLSRTVALIQRRLGFAVLLMVSLARAQDVSEPGFILRFQLTETPGMVLHTMGGGASIVHFDRLDMYEFRTSSQDSQEDPDWRFTFLISKKRLVSVVRDYENAIDVSKLFPAGESEIRSYPDEKNPTMTVIVRKLDGGRVFLARLEPGSNHMADQLVLANPMQAALLFPFIEKPK